MAMTPELWGRQRPHLPWPLVSTSPSAISVEHVYNRDYWRHRESDQPILGGYVLPPFQRPPSWDDRRRALYVESLLLGLQGMPIIWNDAGEADGEDGGPHATDGWLIDGQGRIGAILAYACGDLEIFEGSPHRHRWADLSANERGVFARIQLPSVRLQSSSIEDLREIYRRLAHGGVPHPPETE